MATHASTSRSSAGRRHKWSIDLYPKALHLAQEKDKLIVGLLERPVPERNAQEKADEDNLLAKRSWEVALGPLKQLPMNLFIMWMAGSTIGIFPIMMVGMMLIRPIQAIISIQTTFKMIEGGQAPQQKVVYFLGNLAGVGLALYKCQVMGLLPTHPSDWLAFVLPQQRMEWSSGGVVL